MKQAVAWSRTVAMAAAALVAASALSASFAVAVETAKIDVAAILADTPFTEADVEKVMRGEIVRRDEAGPDERDIMVLLAHASSHSPEAVADIAMRDFADLHVDETTVQLRRLRADAGLADFEGISLGDEDARELLEARPGVRWNFSPGELERFAALRNTGANAAQASALLREMLHARFEAYVERGLDGVAPYARKGGKQMDAGEALRAPIRDAKSRILGPELKSLLLTPPAKLGDDVRQVFLWVEREREGRRIFTLRHRMVFLAGGAVMGLDREFYVTGSYNAFQEFAAVLPTRDGSLVFGHLQTSTDRVAGFGAAMRMRIARRMMADSLISVIELLR